MNKSWVKNYQEGVPAEINPDRHASLVDYFKSICKKFHDRPAYSNMGHALTYCQTEVMVRHFASFLQNQYGIKKGDRVALMMPNVLQYPVVLFACLYCGAIVVNVNPLYTAPELEKQLNDADAGTIIVLDNFAHTVSKVHSKTKIKNIVVTSIGDLFPFVKKNLVNFVVKRVKKMVPPYKLEGAITFTKAMKTGKRRRFTPVDIAGADIAFLQYTGGTTGVAKGAILTHRNIIANVEQCRMWIKPKASPDRDILITPLPLYHIFSLTANLMVFMSWGALNVLITNPRDLKGFVKELKKIPFTAFTGVNTLFNGLLHQKGFDEIDFSNLHLTIGGGMAVQRSVAEQWHDVTGCPLLEGYGLTETSPVVCISPMYIEEYNGSIGLPMPSTNLSLRDDNDKEVELGEEGELCVQGPQVMRGYWNNPDETAKVLDEDGWFHTGDIARVDEQGFVRIIERKKDMILVSGFNVYPNEVEGVLAAHPAVLEAAVIGVPNEQSGEKVKAFIVKKHKDVSADELVLHCREQLTAYKIPKLIEFRDELPKSNVGKILRRELRENRL